MSDGYRWESRGMYEYYIDATGKIQGRTFYLFSDMRYDAEVDREGTFVRVGTYVSLEDARRAVERAVAQSQAQTPAELGPRIVTND